jgi:hypothetical protein
VARLTRSKRLPILDAVDQAGLDSFPASDPSSLTTTLGPPDYPRDTWPLPERELVEVREHPMSDPACR